MSVNSDGTELLPNVGSRKLPVDFRQALRYLWWTKTPKIYQYLFYRKGRSMIRSVVEIVAAICINSIGVALAAVGIETVEYGSSLQFLFVISAAVVLGTMAVWSALRIFDHEYPYRLG